MPRRRQQVSRALADAPSRSDRPDAYATRQFSRNCSPAPSIWGLSEREAALLRYVAEMYALQLDQLAALLRNWGEPAGSAANSAREIVRLWRACGYVDTDQLTLGEPWVWASRKGLNACGMKTTLVKPRPPTLRHTHAVTEARFALERKREHRQSRGWWRSERLMLAGEFPARAGHAPDAEVHYPTGSGVPWAGQIWAIEVELSRKSVARIAAIMQATLYRTDGFGSPPGRNTVPGVSFRYARVMYICSPESVRSVVNACGQLGPSQSARIEVHDMPVSAMRLRAPKRGWQP